MVHVIRHPPDAAALLQARSRALAGLFEEIARHRMAGIPVLHPLLRVQALGFECAPAGPEPLGAQAAPPRGAVTPGQPGRPSEHGNPAPAPEAGVGVLITPWFMNLVWLPLQRQDAPRHPGRKQSRQIGGADFEFISAWDDTLGAYEACSLFSPMFAFADHAAAQATAQEVLRLLRQDPAPQKQAEARHPACATPPMPARRAFFLGRGASA